MTKRRIIILSILAITVLSNSTNVLANNNFFKEEKRGWLWFEEPPIELEEEQENQEEQTSKAPTQEQMQQAKEENERFKEDLELARHMMIRHPENIDYIRLYKEKENQMLESAMILSKNYAMTNFLHPHLADNLKNPQNMYGRRLQEEEKENTDKTTLHKLAKEVELFVFIKEDCIYCDTLQKHLNTFSKRYGFKVEAVAADNKKSKYFTTNNSPEIIKALNLTVMPTVIAITNDSKQRFEIARGAVSISELEEKALLIEKYLLENKNSNSNTKVINDE